MKFMTRCVALTFCLLLLSFSVSYGRNYGNKITHKVQMHDQVVYNGKIVKLTPKTILVQIYGPGCEGQLQFKRDTWRQQVNHKAGDVVSFVLSGECSDEKSVLTVESRR